MLKFLLASSMAATASALGVASVSWDGGSAVVGGATGGAGITVTDPLTDTAADVIVTINNEGDYLGLFQIAYVTGSSPGDPLSHVAQNTGGPVTRVACASATCNLPLYIGGDVSNPVPAGDYAVLSMTEAVLDYAASRSADFALVTIDPYIYAWGLTGALQTTSTIERGSDILVKWDGLAENDIVEYRYYDGVTTPVDPCPVDYHTITAAEAAIGRGTVALRTSNSDATDSVVFAIPGTHNIALLDSTNTPYAGGTCTIDQQLGEVRIITVADTDTVAISSGVTNHEAGSKIGVSYDLKSGVSVSGMYVGLFIAGTDPNSHVIATNTAGAPLSKSFLPVGISGAGTIELATPLDAVLGNYIVYFFNENVAGFEPVADTSYTTSNTFGPHVTKVGAGTGTDIAIIEAPTGEPTGQPSDEPSGQPSGVPTSPTGQPTGIPTSSPSFVEEPWGEYVWTEKRHRKAGMCENQCSGHGTCEVNGNCKCFTGLDGEDEWTGPDCSSRTCPFDFAWVGASVNSNNLHPWAECSNKGICDRGSGECQCFTGYEGAACQRTVCPDNCNDQGTCWPEKHLASKAGRVYEAPWDAMKHVGCLCDAGYRGPACDQQECPSGADPRSGYGNEAGRDCSGRGICDYSNGICACFTGFFGTRCQHQTTVM